ncbi:MAG: hypothetical protein K2J74_07365 [Muribaculaceae bacterium]|nr:hypothetical protein [Muribaculaceae bacterium]
MKHFRAIILFALILCGITAMAKINRDVTYTSVPDKVMQIDSIDYRSDLTRVYGKLIGIPHTSNCITEISGATDIDGVDLKRWYQFEDEGIINVEIDFPAMPANSPFVINAVTKRGNWRISIK